MFVTEFALYFLNGVVKLKSLPVVIVYLSFVAFSPLWTRYVRPFGLRKVWIMLTDSFSGSTSARICHILDEYLYLVCDGALFLLIFLTVFLINIT